MLTYLLTFFTWSLKSSLTHCFWFRSRNGLKLSQFMSVRNLRIRADPRHLHCHFGKTRRFHPNFTLCTEPKKWLQSVLVRRQRCLYNSNARFGLVCFGRVAVNSVYIIFDHSGFRNVNLLAPEFGI